MLRLVRLRITCPPDLLSLPLHHEGNVIVRDVSDSSTQARGEISTP